MTAEACTRGHAYTEENVRWRVRVRPDRKTTSTKVCRRCEADAQQLSAWRRTHRAYLALLTARGVL